MTSPISNRATFGYILAAVVLLLNGVLSFLNIQQIARNGRLVVHTHEVLDALRDAQALLTEAESGQRGYIITGQGDYARSYREAEGSLRASLTRVKNLVADNPGQEERFTRLQTLVGARLKTLQRNFEARQSVGAEAARDLILNGQGKMEMNAVRGTVAEMEAVERGLLAQREAQSHRSYSLALLTLLVSGFFGLVLVGLAYVLAAREARTRLLGAAALERANAQLEKRVEERTASLRETNASLQRSNRELEEFASVASHDLQEPLRKIQAFGDRLQTRCAPELGAQGREYLERMHASATRMRSLIDGLLTYSRVTTKAQPFVRVDLTTIAQEVVSDLEDRLERTDGRVEVGTLPTIEADPLQMRQLFQNLIANGLKFHLPGAGPVVALEARMLNGSENGEAASCEIAVRDNGVGFEEIYLDRIFELFQRLHGRQEYEGTGIGLAICRKIVERHGGVITARSAPGEGATFLVRLPLRQE